MAPLVSSSAPQVVTDCKTNAVMNGHSSSFHWSWPQAMRFLPCQRSSTMGTNISSSAHQHCRMVEKITLENCVTCPAPPTENKVKYTLKMA